MKVVSINVPWARARLENVRKWWGLEFVFEYEDITLPYVPMQAHPTSPGLAVLDMNFVSTHKKGLTLFIAPLQTKPKTAAGVELQDCASVMGIYLPPLLSFQRWEWFWTRLFWDSPAIEVFANETDQTSVAGKSLGPAFELWTQHEMSHWLKLNVVNQEDTTHKWFYYPNATPEKARDEILSVLKPTQMQVEPPAPPAQPQEPQISPRARLLALAESYVGKDASPLDTVPDEVGCADSCSRIIGECFGDFPVSVGTAEMFTLLRKHPKFRGTLELLPGNVIVSPTGSGNGSIRGHVGIIGKNETIMSNSSASGKWESNFTVASWVKRYRGLGGLKLYVFERIP